MLKFTKMEGIGNDYVYFDGIHQNVPTNKTFISRISDRHFGIGSDGMIVILPSENYDFKMRMFNLDGSEGKMCGNGIRCFAKFVYDHHLTDQTYLEIETLAGVKKVWLTVEDNQVKSVKVDMGEPSLKVKDIPCLFEKEEMINEPILIGQQVYRLTSVSMGNPHAVVFVDDVENFELEKYGPHFENHPRFPKRTNTEFVKVISRNEASMRVWERGSAETWACGTGTCATAMACILNGLTDNKVLVHLRGGDLTIEYDEKTNHVFMTGPATEVFNGEY